ncbi:MAG: DNA replication/repair protein RecF [Actinomycetota bacterium]
MRLLWIELRDLRNHEETHLDVPSGLVVALGANGEGKSNLLEGIYYLLALTSPRVATDAPLVRHGAESAFVRGEIETTAGRVLVEVEIRSSGANRMQVNRNAVRRKRDVRRQVRGVFFGPQDLAIVLGDPDARRRFMEDCVVTLWPLREAEARAYDKVVRQRNRLLKDWEGRGEPPELAAWDEELVAAGSAVTRARKEAMRRVQPLASAQFASLAGYELEIVYRPSVDDEDVESGFRERLAVRRQDELIRRTTLVGPHRDELDLAVRELKARGFASHGESWAAALSLRMGLAGATAEELGEPPIVLLDDPFSALDPDRQRRMAASLTGEGQALISVADEAHVPESAAAVWRVSAGRVSVAGGAA